MRRKLKYSIQARLLGPPMLICVALIMLFMPFTAMEAIILITDKIKKKWKRDQQKVTADSVVDTEELLNALIGCVIQSCGCGEPDPNENKYSDNALSAYEDVFYVLEKYGKMEPYIFSDGQVSGSIMRLIDE